MRVDLKNMTPQESRALAALLASLPSRQKRAMGNAIYKASKSGQLFDSSAVQLEVEKEDKA